MQICFWWHWKARKGKTFLLYVHVKHVLSRFFLFSQCGRYAPIFSPAYSVTRKILIIFSGFFLQTRSHTQYGCPAGKSAGTSLKCVRYCKICQKHSFSWTRVGKCPTMPTPQPIKDCNVEKIWKIPNHKETCAAKQRARIPQIPSCNMPSGQ